MKSKKKGKENKDPKDEKKKELPKDQKEEKIVTEVNVDFKDKYIRLYSEFENYRKRTAKEKIDIITNASENLLKEILPVIDDFERAIVNNKEVKLDCKKKINLIYENFATLSNTYMEIDQIFMDEIKRAENRKKLWFLIRIFPCITYLCPKLKKNT